MRFFVSSAVKDLRRRLADPIALLIWIGVPLVLGGLIGLVSRGGAVPKAHLLLVDQDDSFLSRLVIGAASQGVLGEALVIEELELEEGRQRIDAGEATALLILPRGFGQSLLEEQPAQLTLITNPAQQILPRIVEEGLDILVEAIFYTQQLFSEPLAELAAKPADGGGFLADERVGALAIQINRSLRALEGSLFPPQIRLETEIESPGAETGFDFGTLFLPGMLFLSILFIAQGMSMDIWREVDHGTLRRLLRSPPSVGLFLGGKLAAGTVLTAVVALVGLILGVLLFDFALLRLPLAWLWCSFSGAALLCFFFLVQVFATSARTGGLLSTLVLFPLMMIGGSFFPLELMPAWMAQIGRWTPNGLAVTRLKEILLARPEPSSILVAAAGIAVPAALAFWICLRRLRGPLALG